MTLPKNINTWLFDLDDTLYSSATDVGRYINERMSIFITEQLGLNRSKAKQLQKHYFHHYGTTCRGLMLEHNIDPQLYLDYVNDVDLSNIQPNPILCDIIEKLPGNKYIVTNASKKHAYKVTKLLGIYDLLDDIFDVADSNYMPKPHKEYFQQLLDKYNIDPQTSIFFDDLTPNCQQAKQFAMTTVLISANIAANQQINGIDYISHSVTNWFNNHYE